MGNQKKRYPPCRTCGDMQIDRITAPHDEAKECISIQCRGCKRVRVKYLRNLSQTKAEAV